MPEIPSQDASLHDSYTSQKKKMEVEEMEPAREPSADAPRPNFRDRTKRHCVQWWWLHLIIFCGVALTSSLILIYVAMPKVSQKGVDDSHLNTTAMVLSNPMPHSFTLSQNATLYSPSIFTPTLDGFNASLHTVINGTASTKSFATFAMPAVHAQHPQGEISFTNAQVTIDDAEQMAIFCALTLGMETVTTAISGKTNLHLGAFPTTSIDYYTETTYKGLNKLNGFDVTNVKISPLSATGMVSLSGTAFIPNPTVMTLVMGDVVMVVSTAAAGVIGNTTIPNMMLVPGDNHLPLTGILDQNKVLSSMNLTTGIVNLVITGRDAVYNGQHLPYYEAALSQSVLTLAMNVTQVLANSNKQ